MTACLCLHKSARFMSFNLVLTTTWHTFNSQFYQHIDGIAMGGPASSTTTEIYMQAHEHTAISLALHPLKLWE